MKYLELAAKQFENLMDEILFEDVNSVGSENEQIYEIAGQSITIRLEGWWDRSNWFEYWVLDENGNELEHSVQLN